MRPAGILAIGAVFCAWLGGLVGWGAELPALGVPDGLGVNIHFTDPRPGEMEMLAAAGVRWVRMDFAWGGTEREKGQYDFSAYERLMAALEKHKIRALLILDYSNRHYDNGLSPSSDEGRKAFAQWAAAAARHFRGRGILWEMYNEPNIGFWKPKPDVEQYVKLALEVGKALRQAAPGELYTGPATSQIDLPFLEECFRAGLLEYWCAVSVHPYRQTAPETAAPEYARLLRLIEQYAPKGKKIPILSGEWGYSSVWKGYDEVKQGRLLPRQWLVNLANDVPLSIWYDWHDDGPDPKEPEHHFGTVSHDYRSGRSPVYDPKPAYLAARTLATVLGGFALSKRLVVGGDEDYVLLFSRGEEVRLAAWTTAPTPRTVLIPASPGRFSVTGHTGEKLPSLGALSKGFSIVLTDAPQYLVPEGPNELLRVAAAWERASLEIRLPAPQKAEISLALRNPLGRSIRVSDARRRAVAIEPGQSATLSTSLSLLRDDEPVTVVLECNVERDARFVQTTQVAAANPLRVLLGPPAAKALVVRVENPSGEEFRGAVRLTEFTGLKLASPSAALAFRAGEREKDVRFAIRDERVAAFRLAVRVDDAQGRMQLALPPASMRLVDDFARYQPEQLVAAWQIVPDGDAKVKSTQSLGLAAAPPGGPVAGSVLKITYRMEPGWKFLRLAPKGEPLGKIEGRPAAVAAWICGDGSQNHLRMRFVDATGQTFQPDGPTLAFKGWRYVEFALDGKSAGHWGGANDGRVHWPIRFDSILLIDSRRQAADAGEVLLAAPVLVYPEKEPAAETPAKAAQKPTRPTAKPGLPSPGAGPGAARPNPIAPKTKSAAPKSTKPAKPAKRT